MSKKRNRKEASHNENGKNCGSVNTAATVALPAAACAVVAPLVVSVVTLSTAVMGGLVGAACGISYLAGRKN